MMKYLYKGVHNFKQAGGSLRKLSIKRAYIYSYDVLHAMFKDLPDLEVIQFHQCSVNGEISKLIGKVLSD